MSQQQPAEDLGVLDQGGPNDSTDAEVIQKCQNMEFDTDRPSTIQQLDGNGRVLVQIFAAKKSSKTKLVHLGSKKGRIIAKVRNTGDGDWPAMALTGNGEACWYVWGSGNDELLKTRFVSLNGAQPSPPKAFDVEFHPTPQPYDSAAWEPALAARAALADRSSPFLLASMSMPQDSTLRSGSTGWTTCLVNGCCRSRQ